MTPLFWRCEYVRLFGSSSKLFGVTDQNEIIEDCCEVEDMDSLKYLTMLDTSNAQVVIPGRATFGGVWTWPINGIQPDVISSFYDHMIDGLSSKPVEIHLPPNYFYSDIFELQHEIITSKGGKILYVETSQYIDVESWAPEAMSKGNRKKLRQCAESIAITVRLPLADLDGVYELITINRLSRGVSLSISLSQLRKSFTEIPDAYRCYGTFLGSKLIAAAITVLITDDFEYVYMWADDAQYRSLSPVVSLCETIVNDSKSRGVRTLDLGISSKNGILDEGLSRFKINLGAVSGNKVSYILQRGDMDGSLEELRV